MRDQGLAHGIAALQVIDVAVSLDAANLTTLDVTLELVQRLVEVSLGECTDVDTVGHRMVIGMADGLTVPFALVMLGGALLGQKKYADAEPLLLAGYEGMRARQVRILAPARTRLGEAAHGLPRDEHLARLDRIVEGVLGLIVRGYARTLTVALRNQAVMAFKQSS